MAKKNGFTLIEAAVVIAIIAILTAIAIPNMIGWRASRQLQGTARAFFSDLQSSRIEAIREAATVSVLIDQPSGDYQIFVDYNGNYALNSNDGDRLLKAVTTPAGITVQNLNLSGQQTQFDSRGMTAVTGDLTFVNSNNEQLTIYLNSVGRISIQ